MKTKKITMEVLMPKEISEKEFDRKLSDAILDIGGEVIDIQEYIDKNAIETCHGKMIVSVNNETDYPSARIGIINNMGKKIDLIVVDSDEDEKTLKSYIYSDGSINDATEIIELFPIPQPTFFKIENTLKDMLISINDLTKGNSVSEKEKDIIFNKIDEEILYVSPIYEDEDDEQEYQKVYIVSRVSSEIGDNEFEIEPCLSIQTRKANKDSLVDEEEIFPFKIEVDALLDKERKVLNQKIVEDFFQVIAEHF